MKIFCVTCSDYILDTSDVFKIGGPYNGSMFQKSKHARFQYDYFQFHRAMKLGNLFCPRCGSSFIRQDGALMSEHGLIMPGQKSIDRTFYSIHPPDHPEAPGRLKGRDIVSKEGKDAVRESQNERQEMINAFEEEPEAEEWVEPFEVPPKDGPVWGRSILEKTNESFAESIKKLNVAIKREYGIFEKLSDEEFSDPIEVPSATESEIKREKKREAVRRRNLNIKNMRKTGRTYREIADHFGLSVNTVGAILRKKRRQRNGESTKTG